MIGLPAFIVQRFRLHGIWYVGDLVLLSEQTILDLKNFGPATVQKIVDALKSVGCGLATTLPNWPPPDLRELARAASRLLAPQATCADDEILRLVPAAGRSENQDMVARRYGWLGGDPETLRSIGERFSVNRNAILQVCKKFEEYWSATVVRMPLLDAAMTIMTASAPCSCTDLEARLAEYGLTRKIGATGLLNAARLTGHRAAFMLTISVDHSVSLSPFDDESHTAFWNRPAPSPSWCIPPRPEPPRYVYRSSIDDFLFRLP